MYKTFKMRVMSLLLAVVMVVSCMPLSTLAAYNTVTPGYDAETDKSGVLSLHNSKLSDIDKTTVKGWFSACVTEDFYIMQGEDDICNTGAIFWKNFSLKAGETYKVVTKTTEWVQTGKWPWQGETVTTTTDVTTFTVKVYDTLTINTTKDGTTSDSVNIYRGDSYDINVISYDNYTVEVKGAVAGNEAKTYTVEGLTDDATVDITYVADTQSTITLRNNEGEATVNYQATVNAGTEATVTATPKSNYYISSVSLSTPSVAQEWTTKEYVSDETGTYKATFTAADTKTAYTVDVFSAPILSWNNETLIHYSDKTSKEEAEEAILELLNVADGIDKSKLTIEYNAGLGQWKQLDFKPSLGLALHAFGEENETIRVSYTYDAKLPQYQSATIETTISLSDKRETPTVHVNSDVQIGYAGTEITKEQVLKAVFASVTDEKGNPILEEVTDDVSILEISTGITGLITYWALKKDSEGNYSTQIYDAIGSKLSEAYTDVTGDYKVIVQYAGNKDYLPATAEAYFSVYDNRLETTIIASDNSVDATDLGNISYDDTAIKNLLINSVTDGNGSELNKNDVKVTSVWGTSELTIPVLKERPLTEVGVYKVYFEYPDTATHKKSTAEATLTINDARPTAVINLKADVELPYTEAKPLTEEGIYNAVMESMMVGETPLDTTYHAENVSLANGEGASVKASDITEAGTYTITVKVADTNTYKGSQATVSFTVTDGRNVTKVNIDENVQVAYNFAAEGLSKDDILSALHVSVVDTKDNSGITDYTVKFFDGDKVITPKEMKVGNTYKITVEFTGNAVQAPSSKITTFEVVDARQDATLTLKENASVVYKGEKYTDAEILAAVFDSLRNAESNDITTDKLTATAKKDVLNVGTYDVTVTFAGDAAYKPTSATTTLTVNKADAKVNVTSKTVNYKDVKKDGVNISELITTNPQDAGCIEFAVGISLGEEAKDNTAAVAYVNIPQLIDVDSISDPITKKIVQATLDKINEGTSMSISDLKDTLKTVLEGLKAIEGGLEWAGIKLDTEAIEALINALEAIENLNGISELKINLTMGKDIIVKDSGMYITGGVVSDSNYNTAANVGYLLIAPNATKVKLAFNVNDDNGIITRDAILNKGYDLGSHVVEDGLSEEALADATAHLKNLYIGVDINGKSVVSNEPSAEIGAYTQIAFISDLGNEMYYAVPIVRSYVVVADTAIVKFIDETGNENNDRIFTYDGTQHAMTAVATDRAGNELPSENISYKYIGIEGDCEGYNSSEAPTNAGAYTVIATYLDADHTYVGMAIGAMVISPAEATITVNDTMHTYDGNAVDVTTMIEKTPDDAKMAVIMAGIDVSGDFSENGWAAVDGVVNIDFPTRVDDVLKTIVPKAYEDGIKASDFTAKLSEITEKLEAAGIKTECMDRIVEILNQVPDRVTVTFKEQSEMNPVNIGAYLVGAVIMDPDYKAAYDTGVLVIAPEVTKAELKWNYEDENGVITSPILSSIDLGATAYVDGTADETITGDIQYLFYGVDAEGKEVRTTDASTLTNGVYTQMAYVKAKDISASMTVAVPIMRTIVIVPQTVTVEFVDDTGAVNNDRQFTYDGNQKAMAVQVTQMDGTQVTEERLAANLTVRYLGADSLAGAYDSTTPPTNVGAYTVVATYVEKDANGQILYAGASVGAMVIKPQDVTFEVVDTTVAHDGTEKFVEIKNEAGMDYVAVIVDESNNVNIVLPASWNVKTTTVEVSKNIDKILGVIGTLPADAQSTKLIQNLKAVLEKIEINTLTINGTKPTEIGTYKITALAYAANTNVVVDSGVLTITHDWSSDYKYDEENHWKECNYCHEKAEEDVHKGGTASCTEQAVCSVCGQKYGVANGHSFGDWYDVVSPDCTNTGSQRRDCSECKHFETKDLDPNGHQWDADYTVDQEPSCKKEGSKSIHCSVCDAKKDSTPISKTDHTKGEPVKENEKAATCTEAGSYETVVYCTVCSTELSRELIVLPATGHSYGEWIVVKEATTTETGLKKHVCSTCGTEETEIIPMKEESGATTPGDDGQGTTPGNGGTGTDTTNKDTTNKDVVNKDADKTEVKAAQTGDSNSLVIWISLLAVSVAGLFALVRSKRKRS